MIRITAKRDGFRRAGIAHSKKPTDYPDNRFSAEELKVLQAESMLVVEEVEGKQQDPPNRPNAKESVKLVEAAASAEDLECLAEGEERKSVLEAIEKRRKELGEPKD